MTIRHLLTGAAALALLSAPGAASAQTAAQPTADAEVEAQSEATEQSEHDKLFALFADSDRRSLELNPLGRHWDELPGETTSLLVPAPALARTHSPPAPCHDAQTGLVGNGWASNSLPPPPTPAHAT